MGQMTSIEISFYHDEAAKQGEQIATDMIKLYYLDGISTLDPVTVAYDKFVRERERIRAYSSKKLLREHPYCALHYLSSYYSTVYISRCSDLQRYLAIVGSEEYSGFFYQLCFAMAREMPDECFSACSRFIMTVTDHVEKTRAHYNGKSLQFKQISGYMSFDFDGNDDRYSPDIARWILLPRCIAVNGESPK